MLKNQTDYKYRYINFVRGIAIFLMLWGHSIQYFSGGQLDYSGNVVFEFIYSFHMPLFMLISGYLFYFSSQKRQGVELIVYKGKALLYPILMCSVVNFLLTKGIELLFRLDVTPLIGGIQIDSLWFLWSVLSASIALSIAVKFSDNRFVKALLIIAGLFLVLIFPCAKQNFRMYPYYVIGYFTAKNEKVIKQHFRLLGILSIIAFFILFFSRDFLFNSDVGKLINISSTITKLINQSIDWLTGWMLGVSGGFAVAWLAYIIFGRQKNIRVIHDVESLGKYSLAIYALSVALLSFWLPKITKILFEQMTFIQWNNYFWVYNLIVTPIVAVIYSVILLWIVNCLKKINIYGLIFGR